MDTVAPRKARKRKSRESNSDDNSGDDGKKRGRPRVEKADESAADVGEKCPPRVEAWSIA